jgi:uncharacterized protein (TIGR02145 family)
MKKKRRFMIYILIVMGFVLIISNSCKKNVPIIKKDVFITWANPANVTVGTKLSATQLNATTDKPGIFVYTPPSGTVLSLGANQNLKVDFTPTDSLNYNTSTKTVTINVIAKKDPIITWANPSDINLGTALSATQLNATADVLGTFIYTPAIGKVLSLGANQVLQVDFTPADTAIYEPATKTVTINVTAITTVTDIDGNVYNAIAIGTQVWMVENLKTTKYSDGSSIPNATDNNLWASGSYQKTGMYCWYDDYIANLSIYGVLYNYYAVVDSRKLCPTGWHIPSDTEWSTLTTYLGGESIAGGKMKANTLWNNPNTGADNSSGFTALPGGFRDDRGYFDSIGSQGCWWSDTQAFATVAWFRILDYNKSAIGSNARLETLGLSVRCLWDL